MAHDVGAVCACVADHRPAVLEYERHHIWPLGMGGPDTPDNQLWVCSNCHGNIHELLRLMCRAGRTLTDTELHALEDRPVSRYAATVARDGYTRFTLRLLGQTT